MDTPKPNGLVLDARNAHSPEDKENEPVTHGALSEPRVHKVRANGPTHEAPSPVLSRRRSSSVPRSAQLSRRRVSEETRATSRLHHHSAREQRRDSRRARDVSRDGRYPASNGTPRAGQNQHGWAKESTRKTGEQVDNDALDLAGNQDQQLKTAGAIASDSEPRVGTRQLHGKEFWHKDSVGAQHTLVAAGRVNAESEDAVTRRSVPIDGAIDPPEDRASMVGQISEAIAASRGAGQTNLSLRPSLIRSQLLMELDTSKDALKQRAGLMETPYESADVKLERLMNFLLLPPQLEQVLCFGTFACFDAWLYVFTILPLRCLRLLRLHARYWAEELALESSYLGKFILMGLGRLWRRYISALWASSPPRKLERKEPRRARSDSETKQRSSRGPRRPSISTAGGTPKDLEQCKAQLRQQQHREAFPPFSDRDRADLMKFSVTIITTFVLMNFDASMIYHSIRGQATVKLYVIYNVLEVGRSVARPRCR